MNVYKSGSVLWAFIQPPYFFYYTESIYSPSLPLSPPIPYLDIPKNTPPLYSDSVRSRGIIKILYIIQNLYILYSCIYYMFLYILYSCIWCCIYTIYYTIQMSWIGICYLEGGSLSWGGIVILNTYVILNVYIYWCIVSWKIARESFVSWIQQYIQHYLECIYYTIWYLEWLYSCICYLECKWYLDCPALSWRAIVILNRVFIYTVYTILYIILNCIYCMISWTETLLGMPRNYLECIYYTIQCILNGYIQQLYIQQLYVYIVYNVYIVTLFVTVYTM